MSPVRVPLGLLFDESILQSPFINVLATFVALNTLMYAALAVARVLPRPRLPWRRRYQRAETRSIYPDGRV
ncbi:hypothetical protein [Sinomonas atrocyanea]|jgi:hypothetical protein|uniref:hypothetical protein n=1 Tax=Sinomonas atrocyanea TaxID=37927 RepID=UPI00278ADB7A|nr:hypothetical protein [Sinomonas atrocyanea]MDQ0258701.1 hypothetical protein [Sinomonas atrocyanea]MDR6620888.1 hypothetical protein [Sinomonas atrocyanea]